MCPENHTQCQFGSLALNLLRQSRQDSLDRCIVRFIRSGFAVTISLLPVGVREWRDKDLLGPDRICSRPMFIFPFLPFRHKVGSSNELDAQSVTVLFGVLDSGG